MAYGDDMTDEKGRTTPADAWRAFVAGLGEAGERFAQRTAHLGPDEQGQPGRPVLVADIRPDRRYLVQGTRGDAAFMSLTAYAASGIVDASAASRLDSDAPGLDADGRFSVTLSAERPARGDLLQLPDVP